VRNKLLCHAHLIPTDLKYDYGMVPNGTYLQTLKPAPLLSPTTTALVSARRLDWQSSPGHGTKLIVVLPDSLRMCRNHLSFRLEIPALITKTFIGSIHFHSKRVAHQTAILIARWRS